MILVAVTFPVSIWFCLKTVQEYERAIIFRLGRWRFKQSGFHDIASSIRVKRGGVVGPGLFFILPCLDTVSVVDLRTVSFDVPSQEILTSDSVPVSIDAVVYYNIEDPMAAVCNVERYAESTKLLAATTLRMRPTLLASSRRCGSSSRPCTRRMHRRPPGPAQEAARSRSTV